MKRSTTSLALLIGAVTCIALTACDDSLGGSATAGGTSTHTANTTGQRSPGPATNAPGTTGSTHSGGQGPGTGGGHQDGSGPGNQDGSGPGNQDGSGPGNQDGSGPGNQDGSGPGDGSGTGGGNQDGGSGNDQPASDPQPSADDGVPSIDFAEITCEDDGVNGLHPILRYAVSDAPGIGVNLNSEGNADQGGYHNYYTEYTEPTGAVPMPFEGCIAEYGQSTYYLTTLGDEDTQDSRTITFTGDHHDASAVEHPRIDEYVLTCTPDPTTGIYNMTLYYSVANADGMALSIDNPGIVGSFGTYGPTGTIDIPNLGCYAENGEQTYDLYTTGGTGPQAVVNLTRTGTATLNGDPASDPASEEPAAEDPSAAEEPPASEEPAADPADADPAGEPPASEEPAPVTS